MKMNEQKTVLHVDDDEDIRTITRLAVSFEPGLKLVQCASGEEAIETLRAMAPNSPHLFLLDMVMPGMDGEETFSGLRACENGKETPVVFMSARAEREFADRMKSIGALGVIVKPFDPLTLPEMLLELIESPIVPHKEVS